MSVPAWAGEGPDAPFPPGANELAVAGAGLVVLAPVAGVTEGIRAKDSSEERAVTRVSPSRVEPCDGTGAQGRIVSIVAPGVTLTGVVDSLGAARIEIDEATWARFGGVFDADVRLDGTSLGRVRLARPALR